MPTYCIPPLTSLPGSPAAEFDWWTLPVDDTKLRFYPDNPNWLTSLSLSEGDGTNKDLTFRALRGTIAGQDFLLLSWLIGIARLDQNVDHLNILVGDGTTNYVGIQIALGTTSHTVAGTQNAPSAYSFRMRNFTEGGGSFTPNGVEVVDGTALETTGRMWVDAPSPQRQLPCRWAFQVAIPIGAAFGAPLASPITIPAAGAFKLWYEVAASVGPIVMPSIALYQLATPGNVATANVLEIIPPTLPLGAMMDLRTGGGACDDGVALNWGSLGTRNVDPGDPPRTGINTIRLDQGAGPPFNETTLNPDVSSSVHQNQFFAQPTFPAGFPAGKKTSMKGTFSLANWGTQYSDPTASSWRPIPGGIRVPWLAPNSEIRFTWPTSGEPNGNGSFVATLVRNINKYLNNPGSPGSQNPHQCMLVELFSDDPSVVMTRSSCYTNMNVANASVFRDKAEISVVGVPSIGTPQRDVYLYTQKFNMPQLVRPGNGDGGDNPNTIRGNLRQVAGVAAGVVGGQAPPQDVDDILAFNPTWTIHAYHDTGRKYGLKDGRKIPILNPQTAFGYFAVHEGPLVGWETRINGAEKLADDFYVVRVPNNGSVFVETAIQGRSNNEEAPLPPDTPQAPAPDDECKGCLGAVLCFFKKLFK